MELKSTSGEKTKDSVPKNGYRMNYLIFKSSIYLHLSFVLQGILTVLTFISHRRSTYHSISLTQRRATPYAAGVGVSLGKI